MTQSLPNPRYTIGKSNPDTTITYTFTKPEARDFRYYVTDLEKYWELYKIEVQQSKVKDSIIVNKDIKLSNYKNIVIEKDSIIGHTNTMFNKADKLNKVQEVQINKYKKQVSATKWYTSISATIGFILAVLITK